MHHYRIFLSSSCDAARTRDTLARMMCAGLPSVCEPSTIFCVVKPTTGVNSRTSLGLVDEQKSRDTFFPIGSLCLDSEEFHWNVGNGRRERCACHRRRRPRCWVHYGSSLSSMSSTSTFGIVFYLHRIHMSYWEVVRLFISSVVKPISSRVLYWAEFSDKWKCGDLRGNRDYALRICIWKILCRIVCNRLFFG